MNAKVQELGSFWVSTAAYVAKAKEELAEKEKKRKRMTTFMMQNQNERDDFDRDNEPTMEEKMERVAGLLKKAGIAPKFFPFTPQKNKEGEIFTLNLEKEE